MFFGEVVSELVGEGAAAGGGEWERGEDVCGDGAEAARCELIMDVHALIRGKSVNDSPNVIDGY